MLVLSHFKGKPFSAEFTNVSVMSAAEAMEILATRAREASKSFFIEKVFKLLIRKLLCVLDLKMECDWDIAYPLWRKGTYIFPHCGGEYCVKSRGNTLKNINGRSRGGAPRLRKGRSYGVMCGVQWLLWPRGLPPGYKRAAPTGLCVGFNGYCGPGGCTPGYKRVAPTGLYVGFNGACCPGGCTPRLRKGRPYGAMCGV